MAKTIKLKNLNKQYEFVCNEFVTKFCNKQGMSFEYWIGGEVGGIGAFGDYFFNLSDIILDLNTKQTKGLILQWQEDGVENHFKDENAPSINYKSYSMGLRYDQLKKRRKY